MPRSYTLKDIPAIAKQAAYKIKGGEVFGLIGPLGAGKTFFTKELAKALKIKRRITSPSFVIMNRYPLKLAGKNLNLYHLDLYRTQNFNEVIALGLKEIWAHPENIVVIEWANKINKHLPKKTRIFKFRHGK